MSNPIASGLKFIAGFFIIAVAYIVFSPITNNILNTVVLDALSNPTGSLLTNVSDLYSANEMVKNVMRLFPYLIAFGLFVRFFIYTNLKTEEEGVY
jgi:hypothetical protein